MCNKFMNKDNSNVQYLTKHKCYKKQFENFLFEEKK